MKVLRNEACPLQNLTFMLIIEHAPCVLHRNGTPFVLHRSKSNQVTMLSNGYISSILDTFRNMVGKIFQQVLITFLTRAHSVVKLSLNLCGGRQVITWAILDAFMALNHRRLNRSTRSTILTRVVLHYLWKSMTFYEVDTTKN